MKVSRKTFCGLVTGVVLCAAQLCVAQSEGTPSSGSPPIVQSSAVLPVSPESKPAEAPQSAPPADAAKAAAPQSTAAAPKPSNPKTEAQKRYVIGPLDVLDIKVWNQQQLSGAFAVGPDGMISLSLVGDIKADGLTTTQLSDTIRSRLKDCCLNDPIVEVSVGKINSKRYFVYGEVLRQGPYPLIEATTIMDALSEVGFKDFANPKKITIKRGDTVFKFNYEDFRKGKNKSTNVNIELQNGDRIFVP